MKKDTLKKAVVLALTVCTIFAIYACGGEKEVTMKLGEKTTIGEDLEFTPVNVLVADKVFPPVSGSYPMGFTAKSGKSYATVVAKVKPGRRRHQSQRLMRLQTQRGRGYFYCEHDQCAHRQ